MKTTQTEKSESLYMSHPIRLESVERHISFDVDKISSCRIDFVFFIVHSKNAILVLIFVFGVFNGILSSQLFHFSCSLGGHINSEAECTIITSIEPNHNKCSHLICSLLGCKFWIILCQWYLNLEVSIFEVLDKEIRVILTSLCVRYSNI